MVLMTPQMPRCVCGERLILVTTNLSETAVVANNDVLRTSKRNYQCWSCHAEVVFTHHSSQDPKAFTVFEEP